ncbi:5-dehydro-4-deoxyglucarate dehydratase [Streptomyces roseolilacinus]|uniref:Probable 5-dehydro-4-deoxyglucarate dehydratase n=1 Tax=Streptomyces roseolilacinus TaxID=66904 RepID=A0A918EJ51_9ACTN|nr:5-dehydro-4-deoxyglucarate dehydratase [Streptomyces roseolilacinus]GGP94735.1 putative 5-dehydro-4-deoxyglucarate dehydratase [Streptomyces roseolilacinus]
MTSFAPAELGRRIGSGLLSFPVTHFRDDLSFDEDAYREHVARLAEYDVGGLFAAGGTGEFFSLTPAEVERVVAAATGSAPDGTPVLAPAGYGTATAIELAAAAERAGADGVLLFPPYLTEACQEGLARHVEAVCRATSLGVVVYGRANAVYSADTLARLADSCPNLIGYKDGVGDIDTMTRIHARLGERLTHIGGLPTAETFALPYLQLGVTTYSSAIFNFLPAFALDFYGAVRERRHAEVTRMLTDFVLPYTEIRNRQAGYAVGIVKAGMTVTGHGAGPVRPPLTDLAPRELDELTALIAGLPAATA